MEALDAQLKAIQPDISKYPRMENFRIDSSIC